MEINTVSRDKVRFITREVEVTIGDEVLKATVRPLGLSLETQGRLFHFQEIVTSDKATLSQIENALDALPRALSEIVIEWDLTLNGKPLKPTYSALRSLPMDILQVLVTGIQEAANATPLEETSTS